MSAATRAETHLHRASDDRAATLACIDRRSMLMACLGWVLGSSIASPLRAAPPAILDGVLELRQYTLRAGQRETLIELFENKFIEPQNAAGASVIGTFRDLDDPDRFVWIRGFKDMADRQAALEAFYKDPVWLANRTAAAATMVDTDNVLLLRPAAVGQGITALATPRADTRSVIVATIYYLGGVESSAFSHFFDRTILPQLAAAGVYPIARLVTEESPNNYPRLAIRDRERVFVWLGHWTSESAAESFAAHAPLPSGWRDAAPEALLPALMRKPERLRLSPTRRSRLR
jgi:NIPSNAP